MLICRKKKRMLHVGFLLLFMSLFMALLMPGRSVFAAEVLPSNSDTPVTDGVFMGLSGSYYTDAQAALDRINAIRYEACTEGDVKDPRDTSRMLTEEDYVPIKWSSDLENIARLRAAEAAVTMAHERLNGKTIWTVTSNGLQSYGENLAWNNTTGNLLKGIEQWYEEKSIWVDGGTGVTGHYTSMINPSYDYVGLADFYSENTGYKNTVSAEFLKSEYLSGATSLDETFGEAKMDIVQTLDVLKTKLQYTIVEPEKVYIDEPLTIASKIFVTSGSNTVAYLQPITDISITCTSSDTSVADITSAGVLTAKKEGSCTITLLADGEEKTTLTVSPEIHHYLTYGTVSDGKATATCSKCDYSVEKNVPTSCAIYIQTPGTTSYPANVQSRYTVGTAFELWNYSMSAADDDLLYMDIAVTDPKVLSCPETVEKGERVTLKPQKPGIVNMTLSNPSNSALTKKYTFRIGADGDLDIGDAEVTLSKDTYSYSGNACQPTVTVTYDGVTLQKGTDYTVSYENNVNANNGAKVVITGTGLFTSNIEKAFTINPIQLDSDAVITLEKTSYDYTGKAIEPAVTVKKGTKTLTVNTEYTVSYKNNIQAGSGTVVITGAGNYGGTVEKTFTINKLGGSTVPETKVTVANTVKTLQQAMEKNTLPDGWSYAAVANADETILTAGGDPVSVDAVYNDSENYSDSTVTISFTRSACQKADTISYDTAKGEKAATCTEDGKGHYACTLCGDTLETVTLKKLGHDPKTAVKENEVAVTCTTDGSYDEVVYCGRCKAEISRETKTITKLGHQAQAAVKENEVAATCTTDGSYDEVVYCGRCKAELSRNTKTVTKLGHQEQTAVKENEVAATCTAEGSYDKVVYCSRCNAELRRTDYYVDLDPTGHQFSAWKKVSDATIFQKELQQRQCTACGVTEQQYVGSVLKTKSSVNAKSLLLKVKQSTTAFKVTLARGDSVVSMVSSNTKVFTVKNTGKGGCKITACAKYNKKACKANLIIKLASGQKYTIPVSVQTAAVAVTSISVPAKTVSVKAGKTYTISPVTLQPITTLYKAAFKTSNKKIVTVSSKGVVKGVKKGTAYVTVAAGKKSVKVKVVVK